MSCFHRPVLALAMLCPIAGLIWPIGVAAQEPRAAAFEDFQLRTTVGLRYWYSQSNFLVELEDLVGLDMSRLEFGDVQNHTLEAFFRVEDPATSTFLKGSLGIGSSSGGFLDDEDYTTTGLKFSDTTSELDPRAVQHVTVDAGWQFSKDPKGRTRAGVFVGYQYIHDDYLAKGARCNADDFGGAFCGAPGTQVIPAGNRAIRNEVAWHLLRLGVEGSYEIFDRLTLSGEAAIIPFLFYQNEDSHYLRFGLGPLPNFEDKGDEGYGLEVEAFLNYAVSDNLSIGIGGRYWELHTQDTYAISAAQLPYFRSMVHSDNSYKRYGLIGEIAYRF